MLLGIRSSHEDINRLVGPHGALLTLAEPTAEQAYELFPQIRRLRESVTDPNLRRMLLNPLIASALGGTAERISTSDLRSRAAVFRMGLEAIIHESGLVDLGAKRSVGAWSTPLR